MLSERAYPSPRDVFILELRQPTKAAIGSRARQVQSDAGHIVVRVPLPGDRAVGKRQDIVGASSEEWLPLDRFFEIAILLADAVAAG